MNNSYTNLIITYHDPYYDIHGTLNHTIALKLAQSSNSKLVCFYNKEVPQINSEDAFLVDISECLQGEKIYHAIYENYNLDILAVCQEILDDYIPRKILFFNEFYFLKYFPHYQGQIIYFLRCLSGRLLLELRNHKPIKECPIYQGAEKIELKRNKAEREVINKPDIFIVDSRHSKTALKETYNKDSIHIEGEIETKNFTAIPTPNFNLNSAYFLGRRDWQKGLFRLKKPIKYDLALIGGQILSKGDYEHLKDLPTYDFAPFEEYIKIIKNIPFALFPHIWESHGIALKEAMAMGKIVIVQKNSGGLSDQVIDKVNGLHFDFGNFNDWEFFIDEIREKIDLEQVSNSARKTVKPHGQNESIIRLSNILRS